MQVLIIAVAVLAGLALVGYAFYTHHELEKLKMKLEHVGAELQIDVEQEWDEFRQAVDRKANALRSKLKGVV